MNQESKLSRRRMLQMTGAGMLGAGALLAGAGCAKETPAPAPEPVKPQSITRKIYDPSGSVAITQLFTPRLDTLDGKTIAFVADDAWEDDRTFPIIKDFLETKYQGVKVITQDNFAHGIAEITKANNGIAEQMKEMGVDAAIVGNAG